MDEDFDDIIQEFMIESTEGLDQLDRDLVVLEQDPESKETIASIFRTVHTIKGTSGFLSFGKLEKVAHAGENLLSLIRDGKLKVHIGIINTLLSMGDAVREVLDQIATNKTEGDGDYSSLIEMITCLAVEDDEETAGQAPVVELKTKKEEPPTIDGIGLPELKSIEAEEPSASAKAPVKAEDEPIELTQFGGNPNESKTVKVTEGSIRVGVGLLDKLMALVGELVLTRNQILQFTANQDDANFSATTQRLNLIATELQEGVMKTRMQPIGNVWNKFPRVVRDLASQCGKKINLVMEGKDTELDKTLIEAIKDPLTHIVRNSADHGIELPDVRRAANKPEEGTLLLRALHEGGKVNIEISDDGGRINFDRVIEKALNLGLLTESQVEYMTVQEKTNLLFLPGLSTAKNVTNVSGRGVGMDVVKTNIEKIGGSIDIQSKPGEGTIIKIRIPLTLAIIPALTVSCCQERFAIPQVSLLELVRLENKSVIESIQGTPVYRLRGNLLPIVFLDEVLCLEKGSENGNGVWQDESVSIVVLQADDHQFGLVVDKINDTEEIVVKPLGKTLKEITCYAGATIMGDGKVALILDVMGIANSSKILGKDHNKSLLETDEGLDTVASERQNLLLIESGSSSRMAIPLSAISRLEEIPFESLEAAGNRSVVQYRGEILPLINLDDAIGNHSSSNKNDDDTLKVVVYSENGRSVGLIVKNIQDIVEEDFELKPGMKRSGIIGTAIIQNKVTELLDVPEIIKSADPNFYETIGVN